MYIAKQKQTHRYRKQTSVYQSGRGKDLGTTSLSEISHTEKDTYHKISLLEGM